MISSQNEFDPFQWGYYCCFPNVSLCTVKLCKRTYATEQFSHPFISSLLHGHCSTAKRIINGNISRVINDYTCLLLQLSLDLLETRILVCVCVCVCLFCIQIYIFGICVCVCECVYVLCIWSRWV